MTRVAVIGANGNVGSVLLRALNDDPNVEAVAVCRNRAGAAQLPEGRHELRLGSISDAAVAPSLIGDCAAVVNCAFAIGPPREAFRENLAMIRNVAAAAAVRNAVFLSTVAVHGSCPDARRTTFEKPKWDNAYGEEKWHLEQKTASILREAGKRSVIVRLGHVYGPGQWLSRETFEFLRDPAFKLPFGGARPSNAIHADNAAAALRWLSGAPVEGLFNLTDYPQRSWRDLFDWHAMIAGLPPAPSLDDASSNAMREEMLRELRRSPMTRTFLDFGTWFRTLPYARLIGSAPLRSWLSSPLSAMPPKLQAKIKGKSALTAVRAMIASLPRPQSATRPWHFGDAVPGPHVSFDNVPPFTTQQQREEELRHWYAQTRPFAPIFAEDGAA
jgi:nucleoside-diphosphate-sugar epimerase